LAFLNEDRGTARRVGIRIHPGWRKMPATEYSLTASGGRLLTDHQHNGRKRSGRYGCRDRQVERYIVIGRKVFQVVFPEVGVGEEVLEEA